ncbi:hypothetical protein OK016_27480 [Vibrio chagasii]|nr:hypothetical protein [Vibrio chagasii]
MFRPAKSSSSRRKVRCVTDSQFNGDATFDYTDNNIRLNKVFERRRLGYINHLSDDPIAAVCALRGLKMQSR